MPEIIAQGEEEAEGIMAMARGVVALLQNTCNPIQASVICASALGLVAGTSSVSDRHGEDLVARGSNEAMRIFKQIRSEHSHPEDLRAD